MRRAAGCLENTARLPSSLPMAAMPAVDAEGVLVNQDSPIQKIADLNGRKVAFNKI